MWPRLVLNVLRAAHVTAESLASNRRWKLALASG